MSTAGRVAIFLSHDDTTALRLAGSCALTAVSMGNRVDLYAFGPAVRALVEGLAEGAGGDPDAPAATLAEARAGQPGLRLLACSASVVEERVPLADAERAFDAVVGWPTILEWSRGVIDRFFF